MVTRLREGPEGHATSVAFQRNQPEETRLATESDENSIAWNGDAARDSLVRHTEAGSPDRMWSGVSRCPTSDEYF